MADITALFRFAVEGGFWRWLGIAVLVGLVFSGVRETFAAMLVAIRGRGDQ